MIIFNIQIKNNSYDITFFINELPSSLDSK
jgi:hypothetical protein